MSATPFSARLAFVMMAVVLAASVLTVTLDYLKFRRVLRAQEDAVYLFAANDLAATLEDGMNLGLPLAALSTTQGLIQRRRLAEGGTLGITVFDSTGVILFDTDRFRIGGRLPDAWAAPFPGARDWRANLNDAYLVGAPIINNFGQPAGGVVLRFDPAALETRMNAILLAMLRAAIVMLAVTAAVAVAVAVVLTRRHRIWFARAHAQIAALAPGAPVFDGTPIEGSEALMQSVHDTSRTLDAAETALMRLGTGETAPVRAEETHRAA